MTLLTKGMGAVLKGITTKSGKHAKLAEKGYEKKTVTRLTTTKQGGKTMTRMVGPLKGFSTEPKLPKRKGQGVLFTEKYETMPKDPNVLPGQLSFKFMKRKRKATDPVKKLKTLSKKAEIK
jgi:hypothetical protein